MAALLGIAVRSASRAPMEALEEAEITLEKGVAEDFRGGVENRQVTVLVKEDWEKACSDLGVELSWTTRRANLLVDELDLKESTGGLIRISDVLLEITGETLPCPRMDEQRQGLTEALEPDWRAGVTCKVVEGGAIRVGDTVEVERTVTTA
jgi:MOSC domain-containing protein YiiM